MMAHFPFHDTFPDTRPGHAPGHAPAQASEPGADSLFLAAELASLAESMTRVAGRLCDAADWPRREDGSRLRDHAGTLIGASSAALEWAREIAEPAA